MRNSLEKIKIKIKRSAAMLAEIEGNTEGNRGRQSQIYAKVV